MTNPTDPMINSAIRTAFRLWELFNERKWEEAERLLADHFICYWPQSKETIKGPSNFIAVNREYPGTHEIKVINHQYSGNDRDHIDQVTTQVLVKSTYPDGKYTEQFAVSFFEVENDLIVKLTEYWAETYPAPEWRKQWVEQV